MSILIGAKFKDNPKQYVFKCYDAVQLGDLVVVDTALGFNVVTVTEIEPKDIVLPTGQLREVVQVVDMTPYNIRKAKAEELKELKKKMDKKVKELQDLAIYEMLAEKDPELREMLNKLKDLI
jgi:hypothetical protein